MGRGPGRSGRKRAPGGELGGSPSPGALVVSGAGEGALARLGNLESLEHAYEVWLGLKLEHASATARWAERRRRLDEEASFLVAAIKRAGGGQQRQAPADARLLGLEQEAEGRLAAACEALDAEIATESQRLEAGLLAVQAEVERRVTAAAQQAPPRLEILLRPLATGQVVVHFARVTPDEAVLLLHALTGKIPTRYGYLFDDATDDSRQPPPSLYPDAGVPPDQVRPPTEDLRARLEAKGALLPVKGLIPLVVASPGEPTELFILRQRGPVMEAEIRDHANFRSLLWRDEGERLIAHLLRLKLDGKLEVALSAG
jgi:hypothetical protein